MKQLLKNAFGIYPNERHMVFRFLRLTIFWATASSLTETLSIGFFLDKIGSSSLPLMFLLIAIGMIGVSSFFLYLLKTIPPEKTFFSVLASSALFYTAVFISLFFHPGNWFWFGLQFFTYIFVAAMLTCFWNLLDQYHDLQEAKRLYGIYTAVYFLGASIAGLIINQALGFLGPKVLYALVTILLLFAIRETLAITQDLSPIEDVVSESLFIGEKNKISTIVRLFLKSPFALALVGISLSTQLLRTCTEFHYMESLERLLHTASSGENTITEFLGKCRGFIAFGNIVLSLFFYRRFVARVGIGNILLVPPLFFLILYFQWIFSSGLFLAILGVIAIEMFLFTFQDNSFNLLVNAAPSKLKGFIRIVSDSFFDPIGMFLSSIFLLFLPGNSRYFGLALSLLFLSIALYLRYLYPKSIFLNLKQNLMHFERKIKDWISVSSLSRTEQKEIKDFVKKALHENSEDKKILAYEAVISLQEKSFLPRLIESTKTLSTNGKIALIKQLDASLFSDDPLVLETIKNWTFSLEEPLSHLCHFYLSKKLTFDPDEVKKDLDSPHLLLRAAAIVSLKKSDLPFDRTIAKKELDLLTQSKDIEEISISLEILSLESSLDTFKKILPLLSHASLKIQRDAAKALSLIANKKMTHFSETLLEKLSESTDNQFRLYCLEALGKMGDSTTVKELLSCAVFFRPSERRLTETILLKMGLKIVPVLLTILKDSTLHDRCRILAGKILGFLSLPQLQAGLFEVIDKEIDRAYFYFFYGHMVQKQYPLYDLHMLKNALLTGYQSAIDFIIHLLGSAGSIEDCDFLVHTLRNPTTKAHADAIETLERNCNISIFSRIRPLIDDIPLEEKIDVCLEQKSLRKKLSLIELIGKLEHSPSLFEKAVVAHLQAKFQMPNWQQSLKEQIKSENRPFHHFAYELLES